MPPASRGEPPTGRYRKAISGYFQIQGNIQQDQPILSSSMDPFLLSHGKLFGKLGLLRNLEPAWRKRRAGCSCVAAAAAGPQPVALPATATVAGLN